ncbi:MAG: translocation/assembly module TamB [Bacteroides sp.]|nr:translocation/assembly module TamB [Bacteroides sp.]
MSVFIARQLSELLDTQVSIGRVNMGLLNRIIIDDLLLNDHSGEELLKVTRLSAKFEILPLFQQKISIGNVQLFGFNIQLHRETPDTPSNFQFVIDALTPETPRNTELDLRINSLLMRRGKLSYDVWSEQETPGRFNPRHIRLNNIIANISLKALQTDSINAAVKRLSVEEHSGFDLQRISMKVLANEKEMRIENLSVDLPGTALRMDTIRMVYDSLGAFRQVTQEVEFSFRMLPSHITLQDFAPFVPAFGHFSEKLFVGIDADGTINNLNCSRLDIVADEHIRLHGNVSFQELSSPEDAFVFGHLSQLYADSWGIDFLLRNLSSGYQGVPPVLDRLGSLSFRGEVSGYFTDLVTYGVLQTDLGVAQTDVKLSIDKEKDLFSYSGIVKTSDFDLGNLIANEQFGNVTFNLDIDGKHQTSQLPSIEIKGLVSSIEYREYKYENITIDGTYQRGGFNGQIALDDENGSAWLSGSFYLADRTPSFNFKAIISGFRPHDLNITSNYEDTEFSLKLAADFTGKNIDEMIGEIHVDSFLYVSPGKNYFLDNLRVVSSRQASTNQLSVRSEFLQAHIEGNYSYRTLPNSILNTLKRYLPSLILPDKTLSESSNDFSFEIHLQHADLLSTVFDIPLRLYNPVSIKGYLNESGQRLRVHGYFPRLRYGNMFIESGMLLCENPGDSFTSNIRFTSQRPTGAVNVSLETQTKDDKILSRLHWGNNSPVTYSGELSATTSFSRREGDNPFLETLVDIQPTEIILNDSIWNLHPSQILIKPGAIYVDDFFFSHKDQFVRINGLASENNNDSIVVDLKDIDISYVFDIAKVRNVDFKGHATGKAYASGIFAKPVMNTELFVRDFIFNEGLLGDLHVQGMWDDEEEGILLNAHIQEQEIARTYVNGYIYPLKPRSGLELFIDAQGTNIKFLEFYMGSVASELQGRVRGNVRLFGPFQNLNIEGDLMTDASLKIDILNTTFLVNDSIHAIPDQIQFRQMALSDPEGHTGTVDGYLNHKNFSDIEYRFNIDVHNMLVMNTQESPDFPFYGTVYASGNARLSGNTDELHVNAAVTTNRNTNFVYSLATAAMATSNHFINFTDKTPRRLQPDSIDYVTSDYQRFLQQEEESETDIRLDILVEATPDASVRIIMDPNAGDDITARGTGSIRTEFFNKGDVKLFGNYRISQGSYKFSLQEVIRKDFIIQEGSNILFNGDPFDANLDIQAVYTVNSVSLNDLIASGSGTSSLTAQPNVRVNCLMNLSGNLTQPTIKLGIELPNERDEVQAMVRHYTNTEEELSMQFLYLLGIGKFYTPDYAGVSQSSNMMTSVLSSTLSGQLNNLFSQIINNNNWSLGTNLSAGDKGWTDMEVEAILSGQLLNNRLLINGNFGYRDNPLSTTNFVGDFQAEWLLTRSGDIRLKGYNETNDRYYTRSALTTQGIGIIYRKDFNKWSDLFWKKRWLRKREQQDSADAEPQEEDPGESGPTQDGDTNET